MFELSIQTEYTYCKCLHCMLHEWQCNLSQHCSYCFPTYMSHCVLKKKVLQKHHSECKQQTKVDPLLKMSGSPAAQRKAGSPQWKEQTCNIDCTLPIRAVRIPDLPKSEQHQHKFSLHHNYILLMIHSSRKSPSDPVRFLCLQRIMRIIITFISIIFPLTNSPDKNNLTFLSSFYGLEAVDITVTFTSSQNTAAFWPSFKQTLLYPPDSLPLNVTFVFWGRLYTQ